MSLILRLYEDDGTEIGWFEATHNDDPPDGYWQEPFCYDWELTHSESDRWDIVRATFEFYAAPEKLGRTEVVEAEWGRLCQIV